MSIVDAPDAPVDEPGCDYPRSTEVVRKLGPVELTRSLASS